MFTLRAFQGRRCLRRLLIVGAVSAVVTVRAAPYPWETDEWRPAAPDMVLTEDRARVAEALAAYAWGTYLSLDSSHDPAEVRRFLLRALELAPDAPLVLRDLVTPWLVNRDYDAIVRRLRPLGEKYPHAAELQLVVAEAMYAKGDATAAADYLTEKLAAVHYASPRMFRQLLVYLWELKRFHDAERLVRRVLRSPQMRKDPTVLCSAAVFWRTWANQSEVKQNASRRDALLRKALRLARQASEHLSGDVPLRDVRALAGVFVDQKRFDEAAKLLQKAVAFHDHAVDLKLLLADVLLRQEKKREALLLLDDVLKRPLMHPHQSIELGRLYIEADAPDKAAVAYERALLLNPKNTRLRLMLAFLYLHLDQPDRCLELAADLSEPAPQVHLLRSRAWYRKRNLKKAAREIALAEQAAIQAKNQHFFDVDFELYYATLCEEMGLTDRALEHARKALKMAPDDPTCLNFVGYVLADHNRNLDEAERLIRRAVETEPDNVAYLDSLAWVLYRKQRYAEALEVMNRCLRLGGEEADPIILDHAGDINAALGFDLAARRYWWQALETADDPKLAENLRRKLGVPGKQSEPPKQSNTQG